MAVLARRDKYWNCLEKCMTKRGPVPRPPPLVNGMAI